MRLSEYSDEDLIEEIGYRGIKIEIFCSVNDTYYKDNFVLIGGIRFYGT